jgi:hypothetical protein
MKRYLDARHAIIDWIGLHGAMPGLHAASGDPVIFRAGGWRVHLQAGRLGGVLRRSRTGPIGPARRRQPESFDHAFVSKERGKREGAGPKRSVVELLRALPVTNER